MKNRMKNRGMTVPGSDTTILQHDFDRLAAGLFLPASVRSCLRILLLFDMELGKIRHHVADPGLLRIRTGFLRQSVALPDGNGLPLARQMNGCFGNGGHWLTVADRLVGAHEQMAGNGRDSREYCNAFIDRQTALLELAVLAAGSDKKHPDFLLFAQSGRAYGGALLLCEGKPAGEGETVLGLDNVRESYDSLRQWREMDDRQIRTALLPVALVPSYLQQIHSLDKRKQRQVLLSPFRKTRILWRAARNGFPAAAPV